MDRYWLKIKESIWFIPTLYSLLSVVIAIIFSTIDHLYDDILLMYVPHVLLTTVELAQTILSGLSAALLTDLLRSRRLWLFDNYSSWSLLNI
jgi:mannose/fructose/N-acetylgalactosamine-specific phosphotransferase system component IIC